ncbi:hypothetical protein CN907_25650 [Bacillus anthracis]|nr:hypothetical protein CN907_25650 [Bacillus anthracis]
MQLGFVFVYLWDVYTNLYLIDLKTGENIKPVGIIDGKYVTKNTVWITKEYIVLVDSAVGDRRNVHIYHLLNSIL